MAGSAQSPATSPVPSPERQLPPIRRLVVKVAAEREAEAVVPARYVIVPLSITGLITGLVQSFGTTWGLFRHYWVLAKLVLTVIGTFLLIAHTEPIGFMASVAMATPLSLADFRDFRTQLMLDSAAALLLLLVIIVLSVFKPRGLTPYGRRKQREQLEAVQGRPTAE